MGNATSEKLVKIGTAVAESLGYELVACEVSPGPLTVLRFFIDSPNGIGVEDCAKVSRELEAVLEVEDPVSGKYELEVSSPGINRPLRLPGDVSKYQGSRVQVRTYAPIENQKNFVGELLGLEGDSVRLNVDEVGERLVPLADIAKANLHPF